MIAADTAGMFWNFLCVLMWAPLSDHDIIVQVYQAHRGIAFFPFLFLTET